MGIYQLQSLEAPQEVLAIIFLQILVWDHSVLKDLFIMLLFGTYSIVDGRW